MNVFFSFLGCPKCYVDRETVNRVNLKTMEELYKDTMRKVKYLKECGFEVEQKWECELAKEMDEEMNQFYGGRTNAAKLFHQCQGNEKIK